MIAHKLRCLYFQTTRRMTTSSSAFLSVESILEQVKANQISISQATALLSAATKTSDDDIQSFANLDYTRAQRTGFPEAVFSQGKTASQIVSILDNMAAHQQNRINNQQNNYQHSAILATRVEKELFTQMSKLTFQNGEMTYHEMARIVSIRTKRSATSSTPTSENQHELPTIVVACAGTTDLFVAEEAAVTLELAGGVHVDRIYDVGVAGLHRIVKALPRLRSSHAVVVCAGMDGALPSVVAGLISAPVVACPTSIGYGASFGGMAALLTMLNSCAPGVGVVNIDNGFGAAALAYKCCVPPRS